MGKYTSTHRHTTYTYTTTGVHTHTCRHTHITVNSCSNRVLDRLDGTARLLQKPSFSKVIIKVNMLWEGMVKKINNNNNFSSVMLLMTVSLALCSNHYNLSDLGENTLLSSSLTYLPLFEYPVVPTLPLLGEVASCSNSSKVSVFIFIKKFFFSLSLLSLYSISSHLPVFTLPRNY